MYYWESYHGLSGKNEKICFSETVQIILSSSTTGKRVAAVFRPLKAGIVEVQKELLVSLYYKNPTWIPPVGPVYQGGRLVKMLTVTLPFLILSETVPACIVLLIVFLQLLIETNLLIRSCIIHIISIFILQNREQTEIRRDIK